MLTMLLSPLRAYYLSSRFQDTICFFVTTTTVLTHFIKLTGPNREKKFKKLRKKAKPLKLEKDDSTTMEFRNTLLLFIYA